MYTIFKVDEFKKGRIPKSWTRIGGIDFGTNFAFLVLALEPQTRTWILYHEYFFDLDRRLVDHASKIRQCPDYSDIDIVYSDAAAKQDRLELNGYGIKTVKSVKGDNSILLGIDEIKLQLQVNQILGRPKFFIVAGTAPNTIREFEMWSWKLNKDGTPDTEEPIDDFNHCQDALRYAIFSYGRAGGKYEVTYVEGI